MPENFWKRLKEYTKKTKEISIAPEERSDYLALEKKYGDFVNQLNEAARIVRNNGSHPDNLKKLYEAKNEYMSFVTILEQTMGKKEATKIRINPKYIINDSMD
ncbi:MAG: hypothetical protein NTY20_05315 [Candidatus Aenigmarchaeota archaeon]|nr:hypothetical protein [Candidatus Aenigmarchaeota archaeon]